MYRYNKKLDYLSVLLSLASTFGHPKFLLPTFKFLFLLVLNVLNFRVNHNAVIAFRPNPRRIILIVPQRHLRNTTPNQVLRIKILVQSPHIRILIILPSFQFLQPQLTPSRCERKRGIPCRRKILGLVQRYNILAAAVQFVLGQKERILLFKIGDLLLGWEVVGLLVF